MLYLILAMFFKELSHFCPEGALIRECDATLPIHISFRIHTYHIRRVILRKKEVELPLAIIEKMSSEILAIFFKELPHFSPLVAHIRECDAIYPY